jgi:hypothetical protein
MTGSFGVSVVALSGITEVGSPAWEYADGAHGGGSLSREPRACVLDESGSVQSGVGGHPDHGQQIRRRRQIRSSKHR